MVFDSAADLHAIPNGLSRAVAGDSLLRPVLKTAITTHMKLFYQVATKHYEIASQAFHHNMLRCPALLLVSHDDEVGNPKANRTVLELWEKLGIRVQWKCWDDSSHVGHLLKYPAEYEHEIDTFLKNIKMA